MTTSSKGSCPFGHLEVEEFFSSTELASCGRTRVAKELRSARVEKGLWRTWVHFHQLAARVTILDLHRTTWIAVDELDWGAWVAVYDLVEGVAVLIGLKGVLFSGLVYDHCIFGAIQNYLILKTFLASHLYKLGDRK